MFAEDMTDEQFTATVERVMRANPLAWEQCEHDARDFMGRAGITCRDSRTPDDWHDALASLCEGIYWECVEESEEETAAADIHAEDTVEVLAIPSWNEGDASAAPYRVRVRLEDRASEGPVRACVHVDDVARLFAEANLAARAAEERPAMVHVSRDEDVEYFDMTNGTHAVCSALWTVTGSHSNFYDMAPLGAMWTIVPAAETPAAGHSISDVDTPDWRLTLERAERSAEHFPTVHVTVRDESTGDYMQATVYLAQLKTAVADMEGK